MCKVVNVHDLVSCVSVVKYTSETVFVWCACSGGGAVEFFLISEGGAPENFWQPQGGPVNFLWKLFSFNPGPPADNF